MKRADEEYVKLEVQKVIAEARERNERANAIGDLGVSRNQSPGAYDRERAWALRKELAATLKRIQRKRILIVRFPGDGSERQECVDWIAETINQYAFHPEYEVIKPARICDTPVDMSRNRAVRLARKNKADYLLMVDNDVCPDYLFFKQMDGAKMFLPSSLEFLSKLDEPAVIAAPYCGPPPDEWVYVFEWKWRGDVRRPDFRGQLQMVERSYAARMKGISQVAALPTGLMLIDMKVFDRLPPPWFNYEAKDKEWTEKASTEDVVFSRDCALCRIPIFCNWDAWCEHVKVTRVGKPMEADMTIVNQKIRDIVRDGYMPGDQHYEIAPEHVSFPDDLPTERADLPIEAGATARPLPIIMGPITASSTSKAPDEQGPK